jgi:hypothetical protein
MPERRAGGRASSPSEIRSCGSLSLEVLFDTAVSSFKFTAYYFRVRASCAGPMKLQSAQSPLRSNDLLGGGYARSINEPVVGHSHSSCLESRWKFAFDRL